MSKPRIIISSDIGGDDADDIESMVHAFLVADQVKIEGLISTPTTMKGRASDINKVIDVYAKDYGNLKTWSSDYPTPDYLKSVVRQGSINVNKGGFGSPTEASKLIIQQAHASSEPLWVFTWGAMTDLAQALHDDPSIAPKLKVMSSNGWNGTVDPYSRDYIYNNFKDLWWVENRSTGRGIYLNESGNEGNPFNMNDAKGHGALGDYFHEVRPWGIKMGDTWSILRLVDGDPSNDSNPSAESWAGEFVKTGHGPNFWTDDPNPALKLGNYNGARTVFEDQAKIYQDMARLFDRAKAPNPDGAGGGTTNPPPTSGGAVTAVDDVKTTGVDQTLWHNARYLTLNDKGQGTLKVTAVDTKSAAGAAVSFAADGTITYKPLAGWQGKDAIVYTVADATGATDTGVLWVQVGSGGPVMTPGTGGGTTTPPPSGGGTTTPPPSTGGGFAAIDDTKSTAVNQTLWHNAKYLTWNDKSHDGGALKVTAIDAKSAAGVDVSFAADGTITYKPLANWQGTDCLNYTLADGDGCTDTGTLHIKVGSGGPVLTPLPPAGGEPTTPPPSTGGGTTNPPPSNGSVVAADDLKATGVNQTLWHNARYLTWNDKGEGALKVTALDAKSAAGVDVSFASDGTITYKPLAGWQGTDALNYTVTDATGATDTGVFHIKVGSGGPVLTPPSSGGATTPPPSSGGTTTPPPSAGSGNAVTALDDAYKTDPGKALYFNSRFLTWNDKGGDGELNVTHVDAVSKAGVKISWGPEGSAADGTTVYKPLPGFTGVDTFNYTVTDADGSADTATVHVQVGAGDLLLV